MKYVLYLLGFSWIAIGSFAILYTDDFKAWMQRLVTNMDKKLLSALPGVFGVLLIISASSSGHTWFVAVLGVLGIGKAVFIYTNPGQMYDKVITWYLDAVSEQAIRLSGIVGLILGTVIVSWVA